MNGNIEQRPNANEILLIPNDSMFIRANMKERNVRNNKAFDTEGKSGARGDDKQIFFIRGFMIHNWKYFQHENTYQKHRFMVSNTIVYFSGSS